MVFAKKLSCIYCFCLLSILILFGEEIDEIPICTTMLVRCIRIFHNALKRKRKKNLPHAQCCEVIINTYIKKLNFKSVKIICLKN